MLGKAPRGDLRATAGILVLAGLLVAKLPPAAADDVRPERRAVARITIADLKRHCGTLASDALEGREAGTNGSYAAAAYLQTELRKIQGITPGGTGGWIQEFGAGYRNIIAILPGSDPELRREALLIGAHFDHVGRGNSSNSNGPLGQIHNGADDNSSGTAALLELVDAFAALDPPPRRSLIFAFWDAEEVGLLGSKHWVAQPTYPLKDVRHVINLDMLGRLRDGNVVVSGWRSAAGLRSRLVRHNPAHDLCFQFEPTVVAESDHHPFFTAAIPCLHLDTGKHDDYHRPTDDADRLNYAGIRRLAELVFHLVSETANDTSLPDFRREALTERPPAWLSGRQEPTATARLGVTFDSEEFKNDRAVVVQVTPGSAADRADIQPGDRLLKLAHWHGGPAADLRTIVQIARNPVDIHLERKGAAAPIVRGVELSGAPVRVGIAWVGDTAIRDGVVITQIVAESPADRAGLKVGDVLLGLAGKPIESEEQVRARLLGEPGPIQMRIERRGRVSDVAVELYEPAEP